MADLYTASDDVFETLPDGRVVQHATKGASMPMADAQRLGLVKAPQQVAPSETKSADATDGASELAQAEGVDLTTVTGSGAGGRVTKSDVEKAAKS